MHNIYLSFTSHHLSSSFIIIAVIHFSPNLRDIAPSVLLSERGNENNSLLLRLGISRKNSQPSRLQSGLYRCATTRRSQRLIMLHCNNIFIVLLKIMIKNYVLLINVKHTVSAKRTLYSPLSIHVTNTIRSNVQ